MVIRTQRVVCPNINAGADQVLGGDNQVNDALVWQSFTGKTTRVEVSRLSPCQRSIPTLEAILTEPGKQESSTRVGTAITKERFMTSVEVPAEHSVQLGRMFTDGQFVQDSKYLFITQGRRKIAAMDQQG
jgi:hypothetical protein